MQDGIPIPEAAAALGVSEKTVRRRIKAGTLDAYEVHTVHGAAWRVVLPAGDGGQDAGQVSTVAKAVDSDRLRVVVAELQRTRERVAALELAAQPLHGPPLPLAADEIECGPTLEPPRAEPPAEVESPAQGDDDAPAGFWARLWARWKGEGNA